MAKDLETTLETFAAAVDEAAGDNLVALILRGSAARGDYDRKQSDLNLVLILRDASAAQIIQIPRDHLAQRQNPGLGGQPTAKDDQMGARESGAAERQHERPPVLGMIQVIFQFQQVAAGPFKNQATLQIAPPRCVAVVWKTLYLPEQPPDRQGTLPKLGW